MQFTQISLGELYRQRIDWLAVSFQPRTSRTARVCVCRENHIADTETIRRETSLTVTDHRHFDTTEYVYFQLFVLVSFFYFVRENIFLFRFLQMNFDTFIRWGNDYEMSYVKVDEARFSIHDFVQKTILNQIFIRSCATSLNCRFLEICFVPLNIINVFACVIRCIFKSPIFKFPTAYV